MKINWELEDTKRFIERKGYVLQHQLGSINYTCYVYESNRNGKRIEIWDNRSGELSIVDTNQKSIDLEKL